MFVEYGVTRDDYARILSNLPLVERAVPMRDLRREVRAGARAVEARIVGCTADYFDVNRLTIDRGDWLTDRHGDAAENVCVLAATTAASLFPYQDPIGRSIQINSDFYKIIGQTMERDPSAAIGGSLNSQDYNFDVYIPLETLRARIGDMVFTSRSGSREGEIVQLSQITVTVPEVEQVEAAAGVIRTLLEQAHKDKADFGVTVPRELLRQAQLFRMMFNGLLILIAGISLVVGGIGIMNIMLATVTERTREIGIRRALGAKQGDIIRQFLAEAIVLTSVGGVIGVFLGFLVGPGIHSLRSLLTRLIPDAIAALPPQIAEVQPRIAPWSIIVSLVISIGVGVLFGLYPARRAALMDPIEALRHE